jgi:transcriptional regulator with GAF, ATPase, and Fis domain
MTPTLTVRAPGAPPQAVPLTKRLTSVGPAPCDVALADPGAKATVLAIEHDGVAWEASAIEGDFEVNGKRRERHRLTPGDVLRVGGTELQFTLEEPAAAAARAPAADAEMQALRWFYGYSERLLGAADVERLLQELMDAAIEVTRADKGFLILLEGNEPHVRVARHMNRDTVEDAVERLSDTIVAKALREKRTLIVSDALHDPEFNASASVVNLKLCSVMCAPLTEKGEPFGLLYLGNDRVAHLFDERSAQLLTVFAAWASLLARNALLMNGLRLEARDLRQRLEDQRYGDLIGASDAMKEIYRKIERVAQTDVSVLITGETGTGKELIAREIHRRSPRRGGPFVVINCGAIPEGLLEAELFGHVRGAFTGAVATRPGKFHAAHGGTLFLDEIGEMPQGLQVKILRALQERVIVKVGDTRPEPVDIRVLAATNKVLEEEIKGGRFREDLYYRLNVVGLHLPPLRQRGEDLVLLGRYFLGKYTREFNSKVKGFAPAAAVAMRKYAWPGNIRQLENRIKKAVVLADRALITADDLDLRPENLDPVMPLEQAQEEFTKRYLLEVLERNGGNRTKTAKDLGVDPRTVFRWLERIEGESAGKEAGEER